MCIRDRSIYLSIYLSSPLFSQKKRKNGLLKGFFVYWNLPILAGLVNVWKWAWATRFASHFCEHYTKNPKEQNHWKCNYLTNVASYLSTLLSFSNMRMKSFFGGCGTNDKHDCKESSREPNPLYGGISWKKIKKKQHQDLTQIINQYDFQLSK